MFFSLTRHYKFETVSFTLINVFKLDKGFTTNLLMDSLTNLIIYLT